MVYTITSRFEGQLRRQKKERRQLPGTIEALLVIALVVTPGYLCGRLLNSLRPFEHGKSDLIVVIQAIALGGVVHFSVSYWTIGVAGWYRDNEIDHHAGWFVAWLAAVVLVAPAIIGGGFAFLLKIPWVDGQLDRIGLGYVDRTPTAWDYIMRQDKHAFVKVWLRDGKVIGGKYSNHSFVSLVPERSDLFMEEAWKLDDRADAFLGRQPDTLGVWVAHDAISHLELFDAGDRNREGAHVSNEQVRVGTSGETAA